MSLRNIRPTRRLHELDRARSSYPTVARTGDFDRKGKFKLIFDDTNVVLFNTATVSYPTTLPVGSKYLAFDIQSDLATSGALVTPGAIDQWVKRDYESENFHGFDETRRFQYDLLGTDFYATGTSPDIAISFGSSLGSKTCIKLDLPITAAFTLLATSASMIAYDFATKAFVQTYAYGNFDPITYMGQCSGGTTRLIALPREGALFDPTGKHSNSLNSTKRFGVTLPSAASLLPSLFFDNAFTSSLDTTTTNVSRTQRLCLSGIINQPFLLEKCVIEVPILVGSGWFSDTTAASISWENSIDPLFYMDLGGPALTFGLLNNFPGNQKDLILSGTITHGADASRYLQLNDVFNPPLTNTVSRVVRTPAGFNSFGTPTTVLHRPDNSTFSGTIRIIVEPTVTIGMDTFFSKAGQTYVSASFAGSSPYDQMNAGRSRLGGISSVSGRSIFGKTMNVPLRTSNVAYQNADLYVASGTAGIDDDMVAFLLEETKKSPYLLLPKDSLSFTFSKYRSAYVSSSNATFDSSRGVPAAFSPSNNTYYYHSASHDVQIGSGTMTVRFYGSLVRNEKEFNDSLNSRLDTNEVHEAIGSEPIYDEFEGFYPTELTGSMVDRMRIQNVVPYLGQFGLVSSSIAFSGTSETLDLYSNLGTDSSRAWSTQYYWTRFKTVSEAQKRTTRTLVCTNPSELFWDCRVLDLLPAFLSINPNLRLIGFEPGGAIVNNILYTGNAAYNESGATVDTGNGIVDWIMTYPYEPRFSTITKKFADVSLSNPVLLNNKLDGVNARFTMLSYAALNLQIGPGTSIASGRNRYLAGEEAPGGGGTGLFLNGMTLPELIKVMFGTGDGRGPYDNNHVLFRAATEDTTITVPVYHTAEIRGWKHGLASGFPLQSAASFSRTHYGYPRDMMEQRIDTKFFDGQTALDSPVRVQFVDSAQKPVKSYETTSSNLSFEVTSSVPYTDGMVRNREDPLVLANINQTIVVI